MGPLEKNVQKISLGDVFLNTLSKLSSLQTLKSIAEFAKSIVRAQSNLNNNIWVNIRKSSLPNHRDIIAQKKV